MKPSDDDLIRIETLIPQCKKLSTPVRRSQIYEGWNFNSGNYLFTTDTK